MFTGSPKELSVKFETFSSNTERSTAKFTALVTTMPRTSTETTSDASVRRRCGILSNYVYCQARTTFKSCFTAIIDQELKRAEALVAGGVARRDVYAAAIRNGSGPAIP